MKKLKTILLLFVLSIFINAQDSTYTQFKYDFMNVEIPPIDDMKINFDNPTLKPALILLTTFTINHFIIRHDEKHNNFQYTSRKTGAIFLVGATACTLTYAFEIKKYNKKRKYHNDQAEYYRR
jgi:hypothetical protein